MVCTMKFSKNKRIPKDFDERKPDDGKAGKI